MTFRALILGLLLGAATVYIVSFAELVTRVIMIGFLQLPPVVVALMFGLVLVNKVVQKLAPGKELRAAEYTVVFAMMLTASMIASRGLMERLPPVLTSANYYANPMNKWQENFFGNTRQWMVPWDTSGPPRQELVRQFYEGKPAEDPVPWGPWIRPMLIWGGLMMLIYGIFLCMGSLLYRQWADNERLSFPLVALPIEMIESGKARGFWRSVPMWCGFGVTVLVFGLRGLHSIYPDVPHFPIDGTMRVYFNKAPWNAVGFFHYYLSLAALGFFYLLPTQVLFSMWFFFLLGKAQLILCSAMGEVEGQRIVDYQTIGAWFALVAGWMWLSRSHLKGVVATAFGKKRLDDRGLLLPYPVAFWGMFVCLVGIIWFGCAMGMSLPVAIFMFSIYLFVQVIVMARSTAEAGLPMTEGSFRPSEVYGIFASRETLGASNMTALAFFDQMFARDLRGLLFTGMLDTQKMADSTGLRQRKLVWVFGVAILFAFVLAAFVQIKLPYEKGGLNLYSYVYRSTNVWFFRDYGQVISRGEPFYALNAKAAGGGVAVTAVLMVLRARIWWWPFHPLGYALCRAWTLDVFWLPILLAWGLKAGITRYGGNLCYRQLRPFFLGLIFGEFTMAVLWTLISVAFDSPAPSFPWP